jgi:hypothetical protein
LTGRHEAISSVQTLSRSYTNSGGQVTEEDTYFNLSGLTCSTSTYIGTAGTNYYATTYSYAAAGREDRVQMPTGTIDRAVYDGLSQVVNTWAGTDDTPGSWRGAPSNNTGSANKVDGAADRHDYCNTPARRLIERESTDAISSIRRSDFSSVSDSV